MKRCLIQLLCLIRLHVATSQGIRFDQYSYPGKEEKPPQRADEVKDFLSWFNALGGKLNKKVDILKTNVDDPNSNLGFFAGQEIYGRELIVSIPRSAMLTADIDESTELIESSLPCETAFKLIKEMDRGSASRYSPYMKLLKNKKYGKLPSSWSEEGKQLLKDVVGDLPPDDLTTWIEHEWHEECKGDKDTEKEDAALMLVSHGVDYTMIPMFDIMNHRNGNYLNTENDSVFGDKDEIQVRATRRILEGEQIYTSYNMCMDCDNRKEYYGTPEILRDYGFVEDYPRRWVFDDVLQFEIHDNSTVARGNYGIQFLVTPKTKDLHVVWASEGPKEERDKVFLAEEIQRLDELSASRFKSSGSIPKSEMDIIVEYHAALTEGLTLALQSLNKCPKLDMSCKVVKPGMDAEL